MARLELAVIPSGRTIDATNLKSAVSLFAVPAGSPSDKCCGLATNHTERCGISIGADVAAVPGFPLLTSNPTIAKLPFSKEGAGIPYSQHFGWQVQERLQSLIRDKHHGELLIGTAEIVETDNLRVPFLIAAPTMRVPMKLQDTVNARPGLHRVKLRLASRIAPRQPRGGKRCGHSGGKMIESGLSERKEMVGKVAATP